MTTLNYTADYPIDAMGFRIEGMAFDGCHYYFSVFCDNIILKYNSDFEMIRKIETVRRYSCICYDYKEKCFWAGSKEHYGCIFKLNCRFTEIDRIDLGCELCGVISGLSYNCGDDSLLIAVADRVVKLTKYNRNLQVVCTFPNCYVTGVLSISPGIFITLLKNGHQYTYIIEEGKTQCRALSAPPCFLIKGMIFQPCSSDDSINLSVLATKCGRYPYILTVKLCLCSLGYRPDCCNFCICRKCCDNCHTDECHGKEDILESIAREEAALSHILNAEGEKLQKTLESTDDIDKILCVNKE
ncbi:MAG: hypothetical protein ACI4F7_09315, partial [Acutalibacteraceae bacterium]